MQIADPDVATSFFKLTFGTLSSNGNTIAPRVLSAFMAVSSLGARLVCSKLHTTEMADLNR